MALQGLLWCAVVSGTRLWTVDCLGAVDCGVGPLGIRMFFFFLVHLMGAWIGVGSIVGSVEARSAALGSLPAGP